MPPASGSFTEPLGIKHLLCRVRYVTLREFGHFGRARCCCCPRILQSTSNKKFGSERKEGCPFGACSESQVSQLLFRARPVVTERVTKVGLFRALISFGGTSYFVPVKITITHLDKTNSRLLYPTSRWVLLSGIEMMNPNDAPLNGAQFRDNEERARENVFNFLSALTPRGFQADRGGRLRSTPSPPPLSSQPAFNLETSGDTSTASTAAISAPRSRLSSPPSSAASGILGKVYSARCQRKELILTSKYFLHLLFVIQGK